MTATNTSERKLFRNPAAALALLALAGCAPSHENAKAVDTYPPMKVVELAASAAPATVSVSVELTVRGAGHSNGILYLNSETDYRDQRCVTIAVMPSALPRLRERFGQDLEQVLKGRKITVKGEAQRVTVWFFSNGIRTDKYYFQTQLAVWNAEQVSAADGTGA